MPRPSRAMFTEADRFGGGGRAVTGAFYVEGKACSLSGELTFRDFDDQALQVGEAAADRRHHLKRVTGCMLQCCMWQCCMWQCCMLHGADIACCMGPVICCMLHDACYVACQVALTTPNCASDSVGSWAFTNVRTAGSVESGMRITSSTSAHRPTRGPTVQPSAPLQ